MKVLLIDDHPLILSGAADRDPGPGRRRHRGRRRQRARGARGARRATPTSTSCCSTCTSATPTASTLLAELRNGYPALPVVVVSASDRSSDVIRAIDLGAMGFVPKRASNETLFEALRMVMSGGIYVPPMTHGQREPAPRPGGDTVPAVMRTWPRGDRPAPAGRTALANAQA